jgi:RNA polymerase sigma-70 factor (ECF subfamily)
MKVHRTRRGLEGAQLSYGSAAKYGTNFRVVVLTCPFVQGEASRLKPEVLQRLIDDARAAWPGVGLSDAAFKARLVKDTQWQRAHASDLFLATACAAADRRALQHFERAFLPEVADYLAARHRTDSTADEIRQLLRERLLLAADREPARIGTYSGAGPLGAWLRVAAVRVARNLERATKREAPLDEVHLRDARDHAPDPELDYLKARYRREVALAFEETLAGLSSDERNVLRLYFLDGMTVTAIGSTYSVNASTITRWIAKARATLVVETRRRLAQRFKLDPDALQSLLGLIESRFDVTLSRVLRRTGG